MPQIQYSIKHLIGGNAWLGVVSFSLFFMLLFVFALVLGRLFAWCYGFPTTKNCGYSKHGDENKKQENNIAYIRYSSLLFPHPRAASVGLTLGGCQDRPCSHLERQVKAVILIPSLRVEQPDIGVAGDVVPVVYVGCSTAA